MSHTLKDLAINYVRSQSSIKVVARSIEEHSSLESSQWHYRDPRWRIHDWINFAWFICRCLYYPSSGTAEAEACRSFLWNEWKDPNLGKVHPWRQKRVSVANKTSPDVGFQFGIPQGSILGLKNYCMYTKLVREIIKRHNIKYYYDANDTP